MKRKRRSLGGHFLRRAMAYMLVWCLVLNTSVPTVLADWVPGMIEGENVLPGTGTAAFDGVSTITTTGNPIIEYSRFNVDAGTTIDFAQPGTTSAVLNRIIVANPSLINGTLTSNGQVFIVNPAGVIFGSGSMVSVSRLVVSGLSMNLDIDPLKDESEEFLDIANGADMQFTGGTGTIENRKGTLNANSIFLVGKKVLNQGGINAPNGLIVIAAGEEVFITQDGSSVLVNVSEFFYDVADTKPDIDNRSGIAANGPSGKIVLAAGDAFSRAISNPGGLSARRGSISAYAARIESHGRIRVDAAAPGGGGTIHLTGTEAVELGQGTVPPPLGSLTTADAALHGPGGSITLECTNTDGTGTVTIADGHIVTARGGTLDGDGGKVKITADHIVLAGDIDASPYNPDYANGTLTIDPLTITVANGANAGAVDTIYEEDIEALSNGYDIGITPPSNADGGGATNLVVHAGDTITVQDILDDLIAGGRGDVEFHAPTIHFENTVSTDTLSTTSGDIVMVGDAGGINTGHLVTGAAGLAEEPGDIHLSTTGGGDISTGDLIVKGGQTKGDINVSADGQLTVGTVAVGSGSSPIDNDVLGGDADATIYLGSGDDMVLNGTVTADAHTTSTGDATSTIQIFAGLNGATTGLGNATINEDVIATAQSDAGTSYALVEIDTYGKIIWGVDADATAIGDSAEVLGVRQTQDDIDGADEAHVWITERNNVIDVIGNPDGAATHMGLPVQGNVLDNDVDSGGADLDVAGYTDPLNGTLTVDLETGAFTYTPNVGFVGDDTFTYTATNGTDTTAPVTVTVSVGNNLPTPQNDVVNTQVNRTVQGNVLTNDTDPDGDPLGVVVNGTAPSNGTVVLNADGTFTYTPNAGFIGQDTFTYNATDGQLDATSAPVVVTGTVTINVSEYVAPTLSPVAPGLERRDIEFSGIPALAKWVAQELGIDEGNIEIWMANALASSRDIQPVNTYARLRTAAVILKDIGGFHITALTQVINEFASSTAPPTEEQMASIADAIASNAGADNHYGVAEEYLNALAQYISILNTDLGFSMDEAVQFATANYVNQLAERGNANVAAYVKARLAQL